MAAQEWWEVSPSPKVNASVSFQLTPLSLNFGNVTVGKQNSQSVTLTNTGKHGLTPSRKQHSPIHNSAIQALPFRRR